MQQQRNFFVIANWKMHGSKKFIDNYLHDLKSDSEFVSTLKKNLKHIKVLIACPFIYIEYLSSKLPDLYQVSVQNCHRDIEGAFTGEISSSMIADFNCHWVVLGHSERRMHFKEDNIFIGEKVKHALSQNFNVILCVGETQAERNNNETEDVIDHQLNPIKSLLNSFYRSIVIAYEPVWAIGTNTCATPSQIQQTHKHIRTWISESSTPDIAASVSIIYGGSVNSSNCEDIQVCEDVDGFLVGGASLKPKELKEIITKNCIS